MVEDLPSYGVSEREGREHERQRGRDDEDGDIVPAAYFHLPTALRHATGLRSETIPGAMDPDRSPKPAMYYLGEEQALAGIFGASSVVVHRDHIELDGLRFEVLDDVIVMLPSERLPAEAERRLTASGRRSDPAPGFAEDIQFTFGAEWTDHGTVL